MADEKKNQAGDLEVAKDAIVDAVITAANKAFDVDVSNTRKMIRAKLTKPRGGGRGDIALPAFIFAKTAKKKPNEIAEALGAALEGGLPPQVEKVETQPPYLNFYFKSTFLAQVIDAVLDGGWLARRPTGSKKKVMIEYSQPNTHKAFHVGHMRNCALGDSLVRLYEHIGHEVVAANYFGDEGAHVAKCLWYLKRTFLKDHKLEDAPKENRGEWLGGMYSGGVNALDMSAYTTLPFPGLVTAQVVSIEDHPNAEAPANWHKVVVKTGDSQDNHFDVVCGGTGYVVGDIVAYAPVGIKFAKKNVIPKDMKGVTSCGIMVAYRELGVPDPADNVPTEEKKEDADKGNDKDKGGKKGKKKGKKGKKGKKKKASNNIYKFPAGTEVGVALTELGRIKGTDIPDDVTVADEFEKRNKEVRAMLRAMEEKEPEITALWDQTKQWSLDEFRSIYKWLGVRFDHDFYESEVGDESRNMVKEFRDKGVLEDMDGAIIADLKKYKLGISILLKSDGSGLYATKDLALARRKFEKFGVDKSVYVVDAAQTLHFQQVFKVLELMGFKQAKDCFHLAYGLVTLPHGKMSSRKGTVIFFSALRDMLYKHLQKEFLEKYVGKWSDEEIEAARRAIAVGTIKYGMLTVGPSSDIVFEMESWAATSGNTGPYMMYAYARIQSILRKTAPPADVSPDYSVLTDPVERRILGQINQFWNTIEAAATSGNPSLVCSYLFELSKMVSSWYELPGSHVGKAEPTRQATLLRFIKAIGEVIKTGLHLLGIETLDRM